MHREVRDLAVKLYARISRRVETPLQFHFHLGPQPRPRISRRVETLTTTWASSG